VRVTEALGDARTVLNVGAGTERGLRQLRADLESGEWNRRYGCLRAEDSLDVGLRLVLAELA
jgi:hypothetical protein